MLENFHWDVSKPDTRIFFPRRFVEDRGEGAGSCDFTCSRQYIDYPQVISSSWLLVIGI